MDMPKQRREKNGGVLPLVYPKLMEQWDLERNADIDPMTLHKGSLNRVYWKCREGHVWREMVSRRVQDRVPCPICGVPNLPPGESLAERYPELAKQWYVIKNLPYHPGRISAVSQEAVWWRCDRGHSWCARIYDRTVCGHGCPYCEGRQTTTGSENDPTNIQHNIKKEKKRNE